VVRFYTPWEELKYALETDYAERVLSAMLALMRLGESPRDIEEWVGKNVYPDFPVKG